MSMALNIAQWSTTAPSNSTTDAGLPTLSNSTDPISIDDAFRGIMAALAKWRLDVGGALLAGGSANALTVTTNGLLEAAHMAAGLMLVVKATADNTSTTVTFNPDSRGALNIKRSDGSALAVGSIKSGAYLILVYEASTPEWRCANIPPGMVTSDTANTFTAAQSVSVTTAGTALTLTSTEAGASSGPDLVLHRNSASPADSDVLASILFDGEDDGGAQTTYARIKATAADVTDTTEGGTLALAVMAAGALTDILTLSASAATFSASVTMSAGGTLGDGSGDVVVIKGTTVHATMSNLLSNSTTAAFNTAIGLGTGSSASFGTVTSAGQFQVTDGRTILRRDGSSTAGNEVVSVQRLDYVFGAEFLAFTNVAGSTIGSVTGGAGVGDYNGVAYNTSSDGRLKKDQQPLSSEDVIDRLRPVRFTWLHGGEDFGFIAQEVDAVVPGFVKRGDDDPDKRPGDDGFEQWQMQYGRLEPFVVAELQSVRRRLAALEAG